MVRVRNILLSITIYLWLVVTLTYGGLKEGDTCIVSPGVSGSCKNLTDCPYADQLISIDMKKPTHCAFHRGSDEEIVCCPRKDNLFKTGEFRAAFGDTTDGVLRSFNMVCRYNGRLPVTCCEDKHNDRPEPEPAQCPKIPPPRKNISHIAWQKCVEFQRYANICEQSDRDDGTYERRNACVMSNLANKISGGVPALSKEFPHMVLLGSRYDVDGSIKWIAGGTLISDRFVLTAAHAISHKDYGVLRYALLGTLSKAAAREGVLHNVVRFEKHKFYKTTEKYYDIALLELDSRVIFSDFIRPACLALPEMALSDERILAGWGETSASAGGVTSDTLLKAVITEFEESNCIRVVDPQAVPRGWDTGGMICAGSDSDATVDACHGDSGGPLMAYMKDLPCSYAVRGIVSWGPPCGQGAPGVYTNVNKYLDWIVERVWPS